MRGLHFDIPAGICGRLQGAPSPEAQSQDSPPAPAREHALCCAGETKTHEQLDMMATEARLQAGLAHEDDHGVCITGLQSHMI